MTGANSWAADFPLPHLIAEILTTLRRAAERQAGAPLDCVSLGHPFVFPNAEGPEQAVRQRVARERLTAAASVSGFRHHRLIAEPQAAAFVEDADSGIVVTVDFGGGTFDVAVVDFDQDPPMVTALQGAPVGGESIDVSLFRECIRPALGLDVTYSAMSGARLGVSADTVNAVSSLSGLRRLMQQRGSL